MEMGTGKNEERKGRKKRGMKEKKDRKKRTKDQREILLQGIREKRRIGRKCNLTSSSHR